MRFKCKRCGYEWSPLVERPKQCPKCKRYDYEIKIGEEHENI
jgi:predicted Zn-ribbon and HTH transcriptional regulator